MKVIVTDADDRKALASIRALGGRGVSICAAAASRWGEGFYSRYTESRLLYPNPVTRFDEYAAFMLDFVAKHEFDCMLPHSDYTCLAASLHKDEFERHIKVPVPDYKTAELARDKLEMVRLAERIGIGAPKTFCPASIEEVRDVAARMEYPCVVKFRKGCGAIGVKYPRSAEELVAMYQSPARPDAVFEDLPPLVQEYIPGKIHDVCVLFNQGEPRAVMTQVRVKTWPASGGRGILDETTDEPELKEMATRLCRAIKWHGPGQVEFKMDDRDGRPKLMELNARIWGGVDVMIQAGINVPYLAAKMAVEGDVEPAMDYKVGLLYRWPFPYEFEQLLQSGDKLRSFEEFIHFGGVKCDIWPSDPLPHVVATAHSGYVRLRRLLAGSRGK
jgi:predicted ATP-grasp superfamily ATP-dependent carboligase